MAQEHLLDSIPVWAFFILIGLIVLLPIEIGQRLGARRRRNSDHEPEGPVGNVVGATLALLGFMVALTVGSATARFDSRKEVLIDGVNAIDTAFRNAALLPEPHQSQIRKLLIEYVEIRRDLTSLYGEPDQLRARDARIRAVQQALWSHAEALAKEDRSSEIYALFTGSLNEVIQVHNKRVIIGAQHRIPFLVWAVLMVVTTITMLGVGFQFGLAGSRSLIANLMLSLTFALVMTLIFDLEQPGKGLIDVSQQPMYDLYERLRQQE
jgi:hypothetical protein